MTLNYNIGKPFALSVAKGGEMRGYILVQKFGTNTAVGTSFTPVSDDGIYRTPQASGATALRIKAGGDAADTAAGAGAREVTLYGLDENFEVAEEAIATNGIEASSPTTKTFTRVHRARVTASGTYASATSGSHVADITIEDTGGNEWALISANGFPHATTEIAAFSIAANEVGFLQHVDVFTDSSKSTELLLFARENIDETSAPYSPMRVLVDFITQGGTDEHDISHAPIAIQGPADVGFLAKVDAGSATVSAGFELVIQRIRPALGQTPQESPVGV